MLRRISATFFIHPYTYGILFLRILVYLFKTNFRV